MPTLPNISSYGGSTLDIRNLDCVDVAADNVSCDTLTVNTATIFNTSSTVGGNLTVSGDLTVDTTTLKVDSVNNRVGIGNASPTEALDVTGNIKASGSIIGATLGGTLSTAAQTNITSVGTLSSLTVSGNLSVDTNTLKVDATNNRVGINTASPTEALSITGNVVSSGSISAYGSIATTIGLQSAYLDVTNNAGVDTTLFVNSVTDRVGVNTLTPTEALDVTGNIKASGSLNINGDATFNTTTMTVDSTNNRVGIGNATPTDRLDVTGNIKASGSLTANSITLSQPITGYSGTGITPSATQIGAILQNVPTTATTNLTSGITVQVIFITLTPGVWIVEGHVGLKTTTTTATVTQLAVWFQVGGVNTKTNYYARTGGNSLTISTNADHFDIVNFAVVITATSVCELVIQPTYTGSQLQWAGGDARVTALKAVRVA